MKLNYFVLLFFISGICSAQIGTKAPWMEKLTTSSTRKSSKPTFNEIVRSFNSYWSDKDETKKGSGYKPFKRWESLYQDYLKPDGTIMDASELWSAWEAKTSSKSSQMDESDWQNIGPLTHTNTGSWSAGQGRVNAMAVDPSNSDIIFVGTPAGGLWKSVDAGASWEPLTDNLPQIGVSGIAIDATDPNIIYIATGDDDAGDSYSVGVLKSTDGGQNWAFTDLNVDNSPSSMNDIIIDPANNQTLWLATDEGVFKTENGGELWTKIIAGNFQDLKIKPGSSTVLYAAQRNTIFRTLDAGESWVAVGENTIMNNAARIVLDVTPANPSILYAFVSDNTYGAGEIYKSDDSGNTFDKTYDSSTSNVFETDQAWFDMAFAVSDTNENEIYTGVLNIWKSTDGGTNFTKLNDWSAPNDKAYTHGDIHSLKFINGVLYCGSDGGFYASVDQGANFTSYTDGLAIGQFYTIDVATSDASLITGGLQDNGGYARSNGLWQNYYGADGMENVFDPVDPSQVYGFTQRGGGLYFSKSAGATNDGSYDGPEDGNWITPLAFSKYSRLYAGYKRLYELNFCTNNWVPISPEFLSNIDKLETDPNNEEIIYVSVDNALYQSLNGGTNFSPIKSFNSNITSIEVNNRDSEIVYVSTSGTSGKVYRGSVNKDTAEFIDITGSLPNIPKLILKHQNFENNNPLFLGTAIGVWKYDSSTEEWSAFENNLPNTAIRDLDINEKDGILTAATYGRGIWQTKISASEITNDVVAAQLQNISNSAFNCSEESVSFSFQNTQGQTITSAIINYNAGDISNSYSWTGSLAPGQSETIELPTLGLSYGSYTFSAEIISENDERNTNNELAITVHVNEAGEGDTLNKFESEEDKLLVISSNATALCSTNGSVWQRGIPDGTILKTASSGENVYGTNLKGIYPNNVKEYLTTKCYDISSMEIPLLKFDMAYELELNFDVMYVEYTVDNGSTWQVLGTAQDPNWYNSSESECANCRGAQWTGKEDTSWNEYSYDLSDFAAETNMIFRFVFHSDQYEQEEGVVIDNLEVGQDPLSTEAIAIDGLSIFPNPSNGLVQVNWNETSPITLEVFDLLGKSLRKITLEASSQRDYSLDLRDFASGMYLLKVNTADKITTKKLIIN